MNHAITRYAIILTVTAASGLLLFYSFIADGEPGRHDDGQSGDNLETPTVTVGATAIAASRGNNARDGNYTGQGPSGPVQQLWAFETIGSISSSDPVLANGVIYYDDGEWFYAIDEATGEEIWRFDSELTYSAAATAEAVYFVDASTLRALSAGTGEQLWEFDLPGSGAGSSPAIRKGFVYICVDVTQFGTGKVLALDATDGALLWSTDTPVPLRGSPTVRLGTLYAVGDDGMLYSLDPDSGQIMREYQADAPIDPLVAVSSTGLLFFNTAVYEGEYRKGTLINCLDAEQMAPFWTALPPYPESIAVGAAALGYFAVFYGGPSGALTAYEWNTGNVLWSFATEGRIVSSPTFADGVVYFSDGINVFAVKEMGGTELWRWRLPDMEEPRSCSSIVVGANRLYFSCPLSTSGDALVALGSA